MDFDPEIIFESRKKLILYYCYEMICYHGRYDRCLGEYHLSLI